ncbi:hypothetical protein STM14_4207 [Salmonella enterica subsp. enterica serovar Typhimurium str. 14028S]|uniref:Uncharacterized protein n=2 Tax=Salmonella enterica I TaxID=59201 RepID=A0A0F6B7U9_SALT1|nr:hypothetical protein SPAB_04348 [Salmonella enterica subsp. enterica serovar Paratyphi B str. SPB7]ACY90597.1 hypothetical protein STM14_4207 [Salmonella enterica subsp. enterica serovar Typhimurium str. 14028S]
MSIVKRIPVKANHSNTTKNGISANSWSYFNLLTFNLK